MRSKLQEAKILITGDGSKQPWSSLSVQPVALTFEQQRELLMLQMEHEKFKQQRELEMEVMR